MGGRALAARGRGRLGCARRGVAWRGVVGCVAVRHGAAGSAAASGMCVRREGGGVDEPHGGGQATPPRVSHARVCMAPPAPCRLCCWRRPPVVRAIPAVTASPPTTQDTRCDALLCDPALCGIWPGPATPWSSGQQCFEPPPAPVWGPATCWGLRPLGSWSGSISAGVRAPHEHVDIWINSGGVRKLPHTRIRPGRALHVASHTLSACRGSSLAPSSTRCEGAAELARPQGCTRQSAFPRGAASRPPLPQTVPEQTRSRPRG